MIINCCKDEFESGNCPVDRVNSFGIEETTANATSTAVTLLKLRAPVQR